MNLKDVPEYAIPRMGGALFYAGSLAGKRATCIMI